MRRDLMDGISYNIIHYIDHKLLCVSLTVRNYYRLLERHKSLVGVREKNKQTKNSADGSTSVSLYMT